VPLILPLSVVVLSDIHSNLEAFLTVIANLPSYDHLLFLGDLVGYGPQPNEVVEQLQQLEPVIALRGNHDYAVSAGDASGFSSYARNAVEWTRRQLTHNTLDYLSNLPSSARIELDDVGLALFHGSPRDSLGEYIFPGIQAHSARQLIQRAEAPVVLLGHTHIPMLYDFDGLMLANPGSVGQPRDGDKRAAFAILTLSEGKFHFEVRRVEYDIDSVAGEIVRKGLPKFLADRLYKGV
jgi:putative phosphoesterase